MNIHPWRINGKVRHKVKFIFSICVNVPKAGRSGNTGMNLLLHGGITKKWAKGKPTTRLLVENLLEVKDLIPRSHGHQEKLAPPV